MSNNREDDVSLTVHDDGRENTQADENTANRYETKITYNPTDALAEDTITEFRLLASSNSSGSDSTPRCKDLFESCPELAKAPLLENSVIAEVRRFYVTAKGTVAGSLWRNW